MKRRSRTRNGMAAGYRKSVSSRWYLLYCFFLLLLLSSSLRISPVFSSFFDIYMRLSHAWMDCARVRLLGEWESHTCRQKEAAFLSGKVGPAWFGLCDYVSSSCPFIRVWFCRIWIVDVNHPNGRSSYQTVGNGWWGLAPTLIWWVPPEWPTCDDNGIVSLPESMTIIWEVGVF